MNRHNLTIKLKMQHIACFLFLIGIYSMGTISSMTSSWILSILIFFVAAFMFLISVSPKKAFIVETPMLLWIVSAMVCLIASLRTDAYIDIVFYFYTIVFILYISSLSSYSMEYMLNVLIGFSVVFAIGIYWQYFFPEMYYKYLYPLFAPEYQTSIRRQFYYHKMCTGFTSQTVVSAQFVLMGMGVIYSFLPRIRKKTTRILIFILIFFLFGALLLTGKRSSLFFLVLSLISVELFSTQSGKKITRFIGLLIGTIVLGYIVYSFILPLFSDSRNSITRIIEYMNSDEYDISNGRFLLYGLSLKAFAKNILFGRGWGWFKQTYGINHVHNIYLQLLCECGITGFLIFVLSMFQWFKMSVKLLKQYIDNRKSQMYVLLRFSLFTQIFVFLYGLVGNPIYDYNFLFWYILSIGVAFYVKKSGYNRLRK